MDRRTFITTASSLVIAPMVAASAGPLGNQELVPVRLLVLRRLGLSPTTHCTAPCIRGRLYDVTALAGALDGTMIPLLGNAQALCDVIERPWRNNASNVSSIPKGQYTARIRDDKTKTWMDTENKRWRLELENTSPRSAIQFHFGGDVSWSEGCFIVGSLRQGADGPGVTPSYCRVAAAEQAIARIRSAVTSPGRDINNIKIGVADHAGLFPDFTANSQC